MQLAITKPQKALDSRSKDCGSGGKVNVMLMQLNSSRRLFRAALFALALSAAALLKTTATADGEAYSVSLNSPVTFPVDI